jgi:hypothetical protein
MPAAADMAGEVVLLKNDSRSPGRSITGAVAGFIGRRLARFLTKRLGVAPTATSRPDALARTLQPGDVLLIEGDTRISVAIKYLTQSTWSHAALYVGLQPQLRLDEGEVASLVEADLNEGVRAVSLSRYAALHTRICRPVGLEPEDRQRLVDFMLDRIGFRYDLKNVVDLARFLIRTPPVPSRWRRRMIALGSGDPTRAICSTLIAQAFQSVRYPILPEISLEKLDDPACRDCYRELLHVRHHSLFTPRDFDVSPYFQIVKPTIAVAFDFRSLRWNGDPGSAEAAPAVRHGA